MDQNNNHVRWTRLDCSKGNKVSVLVSHSLVVFSFVGEPSSGRAPSRISKTNFEKKFLFFFSYSCPLVFIPKSILTIDIDFGSK